jgi:hypothetical protein
MVEEQIQVIVLAADFKVVLAADEREAFAEFEDKRAEMVDQTTFKIALQDIRAKRQEIEGIGVLEELLSELGLSSRQRPRKVCQRAALAGEQVALDLMDKNGSTPAMLDGLLSVPCTLLGCLDGIKKAYVVPPRQLCNDPLHKFDVRPGCSKGPHIFQVSGRQPGHFRKNSAKIIRQPVDDLGTPPFALLPSQYIAPDAPIKQDQFVINSQAGAVTRLADLRFSSTTKAE